MNKKNNKTTETEYMIKTFSRLIATELHLNEHAVENTLKLLDEGCTIPFISRYRKERTGGLDEVQITTISDRAERLRLQVHHGWKPLHQERERLL